MASITEDDEMKTILAEVAPLIRSWGFKGSGQNYRKLLAKSVLVINFQKSSGGGRFYVNLGVQPLFVPSEGGQHPEPQSIKEYQCIFRHRIDPPAKLLGWPTDLDAPMLELLKSRLTAAYSDYLTPLSTIPGLITEVTLDQFLRQEEDSILGGTTAGNCLHFARIALATGQRQKALQFAQHGLQFCPERASSLRAHLLQTLKEAK